MKIPNAVRYFNKRFLNRLTIGIAHAAWGPFCTIYHVGRRSGKPYETPIIAFPTSDGFVIVLTYGPQVDWYRNIRASGECKIQWHRKIYALHKVEPLEPKTALTYLPLFFRTVLGLVGFQDFIKLEGESPRSA